jgi:hypothetical protein
MKAEVPFLGKWAIGNEDGKMITVVLILNLLIALMCWFAAWRIWQLRNTLANIANKLTVAERSTHNVLGNAPNAIVKGQVGIHQARQQYQKARLQLLKVRKILTMLGLGQLVWQRYVRNPSIWRSPSLPRQGLTKRSGAKKPRMTYP